MSLEKQINIEAQQLTADETNIQGKPVLPFIDLSTMTTSPIEVLYNPNFTPDFQIGPIGHALPDGGVPSIDLPMVPSPGFQLPNIYTGVPDMQRWPDTYGYPAIFGGTEDLRDLFRNRVKAMMPDLKQEELNLIVTNLYRAEWEANDEIRNQKIQEFKKGIETSNELNRLLGEINEKYK